MMKKKGKQNKTKNRDILTEVIIFGFKMMVSLY